MKHLLILLFSLVCFASWGQERQVMYKEVHPVTYRERLVTYDFNSISFDYDTISPVPLPPDIEAIYDSIQPKWDIPETTEPLIILMNEIRKLQYIVVQQQMQIDSLKRDCLVFVIDKGYVTGVNTFDYVNFKNK